MKRLMQAAHGNMSDIARTCGITPQAVQKWTRVPLARVPILCKAYGLRPVDLRPDYFAEETGDGKRGAKRGKRNR
ncbi:MAG: hypothetical protein VW362_01630 [Candidatus Nanopelagicales bacterium]